jgi:hypothetical protein
MNRGRLFSQIEHIETRVSHGLERPGRPPPAAPASPPPTTPRARAEQLFQPRQRLVASPTAIATAAQRARRTTPPAVVLPPARDPEGSVKLSAKALKVTLLLDPVVVGKLELGSGAPAPPFVIAVAGRTIHAQVSAKSLRRVLGILAQYGPEKVVVLLQGKLAAGDVLAEPGLTAQVKPPKGAA